MPEPTSSTRSAPVRPTISASRIVAGLCPPWNSSTGARSVRRQMIQVLPCLPQGGEDDFAKILTRVMVFDRVDRHLLLIPLDRKAPATGVGGAARLVLANEPCSRPASLRDGSPGLED